MIGFNEVEKERNERIDKLKNELRVLKLAHEELDIKYGTLVINHEKTSEQLETCKNDLDDTVEKLHLTNKVRHETEIKLGEEIENNKSLQEVIKLNQDTLQRKA
jgi:hypothetical protein